MNAFTGRHRMGRQRGLALLVTLVLLLVVTVIGIAGMSATVLQERMAGNLQDNTQMFEVTEAALRRCTDRVLTGATTADGPAVTSIIGDFNDGKTVAPANAEYYAPDQFGNDLSKQGASAYQMACLIEFEGPIDAQRTADSLRRPLPPGSLVSYSVMASGARVPPNSNASERPSVILEARVILRR